MSINSFETYLFLVSIVLSFNYKLKIKVRNLSVVNELEIVYLILNKSAKFQKGI